MLYLPSLWPEDLAHSNSHLWVNNYRVRFIYTNIIMQNCRLNLRTRQTVFQVTFLIKSGNYTDIRHTYSYFKHYSNPSPGVFTGLKGTEKSKHRKRAVANMQA